MRLRRTNPTHPLGGPRTAPSHADIALRFELDAPGAGDEQLATLLKLTERYCVVLQTLRSAPAVSAEIAR